MPGGVALIELPEKYTTDVQPKVSFQGKPVALAKSKSQAGTDVWVAIVGIPLTNVVGVEELVIEHHYPLKLPFQTIHFPRM